MALLPNADSAILDLRKLEEYCLNPLHPRGRHKVRVFREALGIGRSHADWLVRQILTAAIEAEAEELEPDSTAGAGALISWWRDKAAGLW